MRVARTGYGGADEPAGGSGGVTSAYRDRYEGVVGVVPDDPGRAFADGEAEFECVYPEAKVRATSRVRLDSDPSTYTVVIEVTAFENGNERFRRRWERSFPRELQ
jgi:hypothetical protein